MAGTKVRQHEFPKGENKRPTPHWKIGQRRRWDKQDLLVGGTNTTNCKVIPFVVQRTHTNHRHRPTHQTRREVCGAWFGEPADTVDRRTPARPFRDMYSSIHTPYVLGMLSVKHTGNRDNGIIDSTWYGRGIYPVKNIAARRKTPSVVPTPGLTVSGRYIHREHLLSRPRTGSRIPEPIGRCPY